MFVDTYDHRENRAVAYTRARFHILNASQKTIFRKSDKCHFGPEACTRAQFQSCFFRNRFKRRRRRDARLLGMLGAQIDGMQKND